MAEYPAANIFLSRVGEEQNKPKKKEGTLLQINANVVSCLQDVFITVC